MTEWKVGVLDGVLGSLSFWYRAAHVLTRHARGESLTDEEQHRLHLVAFAGMRLGEQLLRAETAEDHAERIFNTARQPELMRLSALGLRWSVGEGYDAMMDEALASLKSKLVVPDVFEVFGRGAIPGLKAGDVCAAVVAVAMAERFDHVGGTHIWIQAEDMLAFLSDPALPPHVWVSAADAARGAACFAAMAHAVLTGREVRPRIAATLAEYWLTGARSMLWLLASMPGVRMPEVLVPPAARIDVERLFAELEAKAASAAPEASPLSA